MNNPERAHEAQYFRLYKRIRDDIVKGVFPFGAKLPSKRVLSEENGVSVITVEHAYQMLIDEGYAESRERCGYYVAFRSDDGFLSSDIGYTEAERESALDESIYSFPFSSLKKAMRRVISESEKKLMDKTHNQGCPELRLAIRNYLARNRGMKVDLDQIVIGSGSEYLYSLITELLGRDRIIAIENPSYNKIEQVYFASEIKYDPLPLSKDGIDSMALKNTKADVLHTTPYRSYPSGVTASASKRHEYIRWASSSDRYLIEDDFESEFSVSTKPMETLFSLSKDDNVIYLNTFSKTISPSIRVAYMVLPKKLVMPFFEKLGFYSCTVPSFEQYLITELLSDGEFERHINRVRRKLRLISS